MLAANALGNAVRRWRAANTSALNTLTRQELADLVDEATEQERLEFGNAKSHVRLLATDPVYVLVDEYSNWLQKAAHDFVFGDAQAFQEWDAREAPVVAAMIKEQRADLELS